MEYAGSRKVHEELDYWLDGFDMAPDSLQVDYPEGLNSLASARTVKVSLDASETRAFLELVPAVYRLQLEEAVQIAVAMTLAELVRGRCLQIDIERDARAVFRDLDELPAVPVPDSRAAEQREKQAQRYYRVALRCEGAVPRWAVRGKT